MPILNRLDLFHFLEEEFKGEKATIEYLNKERHHDESFLSKTFSIAQQSVLNDNAFYKVIVFRDLKEPYPEMILEKINSYMNSKKIDVDCTTWKSYESYNRK